MKHSKGSLQYFRAGTKLRGHCDKYWS